jgi:hypothetical protein
MSTSTTPPAPVMRFVTLGGAHVVVTIDDITDASPAYSHIWSCLGCDDGDDFGTALDRARADANRHASTCRAIPKPPT